MTNIRTGATNVGRSLLLSTDKKENVLNYRYTRINQWRKSNPRLSSSIFCLFFALVLFFVPNINIPMADDLADDYFEDSITDASKVYLACKLVNAAVSVGKDFDLTFTPFGIGVDFPIGKILDPIDDMVERTSDILVTAIASLGAQKILYEVGQLVLPKVLAFVLILIAFTMWIQNDRMLQFRKFLFRSIILILVARMFLPISAIANQSIQYNVFQKQIESKKKKLDLTTENLLRIIEINKINEILESFHSERPPFDVGAFGGKISGSTIDLVKFFWSKMTEVWKWLNTVALNALSITPPLIDLTYLYVGVFLIQVIMIPLITFWFLVKIFNLLFATDIKPILKDPMNSTSKGDRQM